MDEMPEGTPIQMTMPTVNMDDENNLTREEALARVSMILAKTENPKILSDFEPHEVGLITAISTVGEAFDFNIMNLLAKNFSLYRVSKLRQGRKEILEIASEVRRTPERMARGGLRSLFRGFG